MMAFEMVPPLVLKVSSTLSFFNTTDWLVPESAAKKSAEESALAADSAWALRAASLSFCCLAALSLMAAAILSCLRAASISLVVPAESDQDHCNKHEADNSVFVHLFVVIY